MLTKKYHLVFLILSIHTPTSLRRISKFRKPEKNHIIYFSSLKAKPYSEMNSDAEGAKRFEVSSHTIHFASSFCIGTSSVSSFNSRSAHASLHFIRQFRSNSPFMQVRSLAYPFFIRVRKVCRVRKNAQHRYARWVWEQKKWGAGLLLPTHQVFL